MAGVFAGVSWYSFVYWLHSPHQNVELLHNPTYGQALWCNVLIRVLGVGLTFTVGRGVLTTAIL